MKHRSSLQYNFVSKKNYIFIRNKILFIDLYFDEINNIKPKRKLLQNYINNFITPFEFKTLMYNE